MSKHYLSSDSISPTDPSYVSRCSAPSTSTRQTQGTEFFEAVYLDTPAGVVTVGQGNPGNTQPLRVRKKSLSSSRVAGIGPSSTWLMLAAICC